MSYLKNPLAFALIFPIFGILLCIFVPSNNEQLLKKIASEFSCLAFTSSLLIWFFFQKYSSSFQLVIKFFWLPHLNLNFTLGIDGISLFFVLLTALLIPLCILTSWSSVNSKLKEFLIAFLLLDFLLIATFCVLDLLFFYIFFESVLLPMGRILGFFGSLQSWMYWCIVISPIPR